MTSVRSCFSPSTMDMKEAVVATFREYLLPELESLKSGQTRITSDIAAVNKRLDRLYEVIVRRDEHAAIVIKINELDHEVREIRQRLAA